MLGLNVSLLPPLSKVFSNSFYIISTFPVKLTQTIPRKKVIASSELIKGGTS